MAAINSTDEVLQFRNHMNIEICYTNAISYSRCNKYDEGLMNKAFVWHQVVVEHRSNIMGLEGRNEILNALFEIVEGEEFYPVAYRRGRMADRFLVRQCQSALDKFFAQNLRIVLPNGELAFLQIQLNVAKYQYGQISPFIQINKTLNKLYDRVENLDDQRGIFNLSRFNQNSELFDIIVNLGCRGVLERIFDLIYRNDERFCFVKSFILSDNGITTMSPFKIFAGVNFRYLDLRNNDLQSYISLCRDLECIKANELKLVGNPITQSPTYPQCLRPILKNFKELDGIPTENLSEDYRPPVNNSESVEEGYHIDGSNKGDIKKFEKSTDWHAFMITDDHETYSKEEIMDNFFLTVSSNHSEIYPCYYKYTDGKHQFLVRECFDQIKHLVENCNLEIKIPRAASKSSSSDFSCDYLPQPNMNTTLTYYLIMNLSPFSKGQIVPSVWLEKALNIRFSDFDRRLNLANFQSAKGLENIVCKLNVPKILKRVLALLASHKFAPICKELCLAHNNIANLNYPKILQPMTKLNAIDLGNNMIGSLDDIKQLGVLSIISLRLDGNPLCSKYPVAAEYVREVKQHFTELKVLDGTQVTGREYIDTAQKNFLCDVAGYNFVEEFVPNYFAAFECDRKNLKGLYDSNAILTMTCNFIDDKQRTDTAYRIRIYSKYDRNLLENIRLQERVSSTFVGYKNIQILFDGLPNVTYDMLSFRTDCTIYTENMVVLTVNGLFLDQTPSIFENDILMAFTRTFVLKPAKRRKGYLKCATLYKIINEQLSIYNPTEAQTKIGFKIIKIDSQEIQDIKNADKEAMLVMLQQVIKLKSIWCLRCLNEANWDFKKALQVFLIICETEGLPDTAFICKND